MFDIVDLDTLNERIKALNMPREVEAHALNESYIWKLLTFGHLTKEGERR